MNNQSNYTNGWHAGKYGHNLLFGTFITSVAQPAVHAVELIIVADCTGLDLVIVQDHPYQFGF